MPLEPEPSVDLASRLRSLREREGLSLGTLGSLLDIDEAALEEIEAGRRTEGGDVDRVVEWMDATLPEDRARRS